LKNPPVSFIGQAQSGTGKTAAFLVSMLARIDTSLLQPQALCLAPTRELVRQIHSVAVKLAKPTGITIELVVPTVEKGLLPTVDAQLIIGSPGRVNRLIDKKKITTKALKIFVLDEADEMLEEQGQRVQSTKILNAIRKEVPQIQVCFFSATYNDKVKEFAKTIIKGIRIAVHVPVEKLSLDKLYQVFINCGEEPKKKMFSMIYTSMLP